MLTGTLASWICWTLAGVNLHVLQVAGPDDCAQTVAVTGRDLALRSRCGRAV